MMRKLLASLTLILTLSIVVSAAVGRFVAAENEAMEIEPIELSFSMPDAADDSDALLRQYINRVLSGQSGRKRRSVKSTERVGNNLTGFTRDMYTFLIPQIQQVAAGSIPSTVFKYTKTFVNADQNIAQQEFDDYQDSFDSKALLNALISDFPYELYWFDKTEGIDIEMEGTIGYQDGAYVYDIGWDISMYVSVDYQAGNNITFNTELPGRIYAAADNIDGIISNNSGKNDLNKLSSYKDVICSLTEYNDYAAHNDPPYGDPWQLIYVFDGDSTTTVVCEGYSKAFKYLCDRSTFVGDIQCILVTGTMAGGTGAGPHMWNIVKMPNDRNYMVDVTNTDSGNSGLFLGGYSQKINSTKYTYSGGGLTFTYDENTESTYDATWLTMSETDYSEVPVSITLSDPESDLESDADPVICGYPYTLPTECPFTPPQWCTFMGWYMQDEEPPVVHQAGESVRIMEDAEFTVMWQENLPTFDTPDFVLPQHIQTIGSEAFSGADSSVVKIPALSSGSQTIQDSAFAGCTHLRQIFIPASVTSIGAHAFDNCAEGLIIFGEAGSAAENYASANEILFAPVTAAP